MVRQYFNEHKLLVIATVVGIFLVGIAILLWFIFKPDTGSAGTVREPVKFEYCGENLEQLCVLSFGRDGDGNTIINLFAPRRKFPLFYLVVERVAGDSRYECDRSETVPDAVYCVGTPLNLDERIEISVFSKSDDQLLAKGRFTLTAFLLDGGGFQAGLLPATPTPTAVDNLPTSVGRKATATPTPTRTPTPTSASYPNYP